VEIRMLKARPVAIAQIYVPVKRRSTLDAAKVEKIAESMLDSGQTTPILVREDGGRFVLVEGLNRLEACKSLGEETIQAFLVQARRH
jgi:ParB-like chromosome segregation protein Spo0J